MYKAIVIGVSAGGIDALGSILPTLPVDFPIPVIIVQHISPVSDSFLSKHLNSICRINVKEADEKEMAIPGVVYFAPANYHLLIEEDETLSLSVEDRVNYARPSIDVLFETAAYVYNKKLIGIILSGASKDGSEGLKKIKEQGGLTVVQDPETAEAEMMPKAAIAATKIDHILPLNKIGPFLVDICKRNRKSQTSTILHQGFLSA